MGKKTIPVSPQLRTRTRVRPRECLSFEEQENNELEEMKKNQFKARPVPKDLFTRTSVGVPPKAQPRPIVVQPFHFKTDMRAEEAALEVKVLQKKQEDEIEHLRHYHFTAAPVPEFPSPIKQERSKSQIEFHPFHLLTEERGKAQDRYFVLKLEQQLLEEKKQRNFVAQPVQLPKKPFTPTIDSSSRPPLVTEPFVLRTEARAFKEVQRIEIERQRKKNEEEAEANRPRIFHARPAPDLASPVFVPKLSDAPLVDPIGPKLKTPQRAIERQKFEEELRKRMDQHEKEEKEKAARELKEYRKSLEFHAKPINDGIPH